MILTDNKNHGQQKKKIQHTKNKHCINTIILYYSSMKTHGVVLDARRREHPGLHLDLLVGDADTELLAAPVHLLWWRFVCIFAIIGVIDRLSISEDAEHTPKQNQGNRRGWGRTSANTQKIKSHSTYMRCCGRTKQTWHFCCSHTMKCNLQHHLHAPLTSVSQRDSRTRISSKLNRLRNHSHTKAVRKKKAPQIQTDALAHTTHTQHTSCWFKHDSIRRRKLILVSIICILRAVYCQYW